MKVNFLFVLATLRASVLAAPAPAEAGTAVIASGSCYHASSCSTHWSGLCEDYCGSYGFSHMSGDNCSIFKKKCCCSR